VLETIVLETIVLETIVLETIGSESVNEFDFRTMRLDLAWRINSTPPCAEMGELNVQEEGER